MTTSDSFFTVDQIKQGLYKEKGSKFISYVYPILNEPEVKIFLDQIRKEHPKARHICYAYRFGPDPEHYRINDDGEPGGTAGLPILNQLKSHRLQNTLLVVVRYFGGVLLGASGLVQAYKQAASSAIVAARLIEKFRYHYFLIQYNYPLDKKIKAWINQIQGLVISQNFNETIESKVAIPFSISENFATLLTLQQTEYKWNEEVKVHWLNKDPY